MDVSITPAAEKFIKRLLRFDGGPGSGFRLLVTPGGCSGLSGQFSVEAGPQKGETALEVNGIKLFLTAGGRLLLDGVTIDFAETAMHSGFVFHDPKQKACGCGPAAVTADFSGVSKQ